jgi:hypothetical protein
MTHGSARLLRRLAALALLGLVLYGILVLVPVGLFQRYRENAGIIAEESALLARLRARTSEAADGATSPGEDEAARALFLPGPDEAVAAAELQSRLSAMATRFGIRLRSAGAVPGRETGPLQLIGVRIRLIADIRQIHKLLYELETSQPLLLVDVAQWRADPAAQPGEGPALRVEATFDVFAAMASKEGT